LPASLALRGAELWRVRDDNRAEALLLAEYSRRAFNIGKVVA
jgi:hypothetical protein